jgi:hypothetical protein
MYFRPNGHASPQAQKGMKVLITNHYPLSTNFHPTRHAFAALQAQNGMKV